MPDGLQRLWSFVFYEEFLKNCILRTSVLNARMMMKDHEVGKIEQY